MNKQYIGEKASPNKFKCSLKIKSIRITSIGFAVENTDQRSRDYEAIRNIFRPGHGDMKCIGIIRHMNFSTGKIPYKPCFHGSKEQIPLFRLCVANGLTLLEEVKSGAYNMVLMDVQMFQAQDE